MTQPSIILGISYSHGDSSAALIVEGKLIAAVEEERFTRVKHYALFPFKAIQYCLQHSRLKAEDIEAVAIARQPYNAWARRAWLALQHPALMQSRAEKRAGAPKESLAALLKKAGLRSAKVVRVEHHLAHLLSARFLTNTEGVACLSFDGLGDFVSAAIGQGTGEGVKILNRTYFPHSVGYFYTALTQYLGFPHFGDEFKVMGLSSYGQPTYLKAMRELIREKTPFGFELNLEAFPILKKPMNFYLKNAQPVVTPFYNSNFLTQIIGLPPRKPIEPLTQAHWDLAKSVQMRFEEIGNHLLGQLHDKVGGTAVALAGGCAHNSVWVGKIPQNSEFKSVFVAPASNDAGIAVGAALHVVKTPVTPEGGHWALLGPTPDEIIDETTPKFNFQTEERTFKDEKSLINWLVDELAKEKIVGLCRDRMEFGPRALGSRSILADPRAATMKDRLNLRVKHREAFRPFAASVLWEHQDAWFKNSFFAPTMEAVFEVHEAKRSKIAGVVHVDNSCRIQSVTKETQPFYWELIESFRKKTGVPMLINTSFNDSEPVVCTASDAVKCFSHCEMDILVIGLRVISRASAIAQSA